MFYPHAISIRIRASLSWPIPTALYPIPSMQWCSASDPVLTPQQTPSVPRIQFANWPHPCSSQRVTVSGIHRWGINAVQR